MKIETERIRIRNFVENDTDTLHYIKYDTDVLKYNPDFLKRNVTKEDVSDCISAYAVADQSGTFDEKRAYAVEPKDTCEVVGVVTITKNPMLQEYKVGWKTMMRYTDNAYASEAALALSEHVCEEQNVDYVIAIMDVDNPASYHVALKSGFKLFNIGTVYVLWRIMIHEFSNNSRVCKDMEYITKTSSYLL